MSRNFLNTLIIFLLFFALSKSYLAQDFRIQNFRLDDSSKLLLINGDISSKEIQITGGRIAEPPRAYIDIENAVLTGNPKQTIEIKNSDIIGIKIAQFSTAPNVVRMVIYAKTQDAISKINLIRTNNSIALKFDDFKTPPKTILKSQKDNYSVIYKDEFTENISYDFNAVPRRVVAVKTLPPKKIYISSAPDTSKTNKNTQAKNQKYIITSVSQQNNNLLITGEGSIKLSRSLVLENPDRIVFDLPDSIVQNVNILKEFAINSTDKVKLSRFDKNTIRAVVTTKYPGKYRAVVSPDLQTLIIGQVQSVDYSKFPDSQTISRIKKIDIKPETETTTRITVEMDKPIIHSIRQSLDRIILDLYNVQTPDKIMLSGLKSTNQFRGLEVDKMNCKQGGVSLGIPIRKNLKIETGLNFDGKKLYIKLSDLNKTADTKYVIIGSNRKVVLDAGHGGKDVGAINGKTYEKDINLAVALLVEKYLKESGIRVVQTRSTDEFISLKRRVEITNAQNPDVFVSVHVNSSEKPSISGVETHWFTPLSNDFAKDIHRHISSNLATPDRGIFKSMFYVIHHSLMPAILVEIGFISNEKEKYQMLTAQRKDDTARSISNGIILYLAEDYAKKNRK
jgi:N-acetylmuramoyl-L-alanine amidase